MRPEARLSAAIELLDAFAISRETPDAQLRAWARANRYAGSKDRAAIADIFYACLRRWGSYGAAAGENGRGRVLAHVLAQGASLAEIEALFNGGRFAPAPLNAAERSFLAAPLQLDPMQDAPAFLRAEFERSTPDPAQELALMGRRAPFDLRVNTLKATPAQAALRLEEELGEAPKPGPLSSLCLRFADHKRLAGAGAYEEGWVEPQDAASQAAALLAQAQAGDVVLDYCAGGGGKTLALAAQMRNHGDLYAFDVAPKRMKDLPNRAARAGAKVRLLDAQGLQSLKGRCDVVMVDAPCSGSGAWARDPAGRWRLAPSRFQEVLAAQAKALEAAAAYVRPGGRLLYATCSLLRAENADQVEAFLARAPEFSLTPAAAAFEAAGLCGPAPEVGAIGVSFSPSIHQSDGFYVAVMIKDSTLY